MKVIKKIISTYLLANKKINILILLISLASVIIDFLLRDSGCYIFKIILLLNILLTVINTFIPMYMFMINDLLSLSIEEKDIIRVVIKNFVVTIISSTLIFLV
ncbi:hypothetical protein [Clostridium perfringens]|uniref:hypothetical protein n=1 Tax=Clostridium perfringens TaxID=1502 RepID=UPI0024BCCCB2|nr:hypothetical protein [Clostridium perfringens]